MSERDDYPMLTFAAWSSEDEVDLIKAIAASDPRLGHLLGEHLQYYENVLSTLFLAEVVGWAGEQYLTGDKAAARRLLQLLEDRYEHGDEHVRNLIGVGFVESMDASSEPAGMRDLLGPQLRAAYQMLKW